MTYISLALPLGTALLEVATLVASLVIRLAYVRKTIRSKVIASRVEKCSNKADSI